MIRCGECGFENPGGLRFCGGCGVPLERKGSGATAEGRRGAGAHSGSGASLDDAATLRPAETIRVGDAGPELNDARTLAPEVRRRGTRAEEWVGSERFRVLEKLGSGGMGVVWKVEDRRWRPPRIVAVKRLLSEDRGSREALERFRQEAGAVAQLQHSNIVTVHEFGEDADGEYIVMEYVEGRPLSALLEERGKLELEEAVRIVRAVGDALWYAHRRGVVHRDVKPGNIVIAKSGA